MHERARRCRQQAHESLGNPLEMEDTLIEPSHVRQGAKTKAWWPLAAPVLLLFFTGMFCQIVLLSRVLVARSCEIMFDKPCDELVSDQMDQASARAGTLNSWAQACWSLFSILSTAWLAALSDVVGRRFVILVASSFMVVSAVGTYLVIELRWPLEWLPAFYVVSGLGGTFTSLNAATFAFAADLSAADRRPARFAVLEGVIFAGGVVGPFLGGWLYEHTRPSAPFACAACLYAAVILYAALALPEPVDGARCSRWRQVPYLGTTKATLRMLSPCGGESADGLGGTGGSVAGSAAWLAVFFVVYAADSQASTAVVLLTDLGNTSAVFMTPEQVGLLYGTSAFCKFLVLVALGPALVALFGPELAPPIGLRAGCLVGALCTCAYGLAPSVPVLWALVAVESAIVLTLPAVRAMLSAACASEQGRVLGAISIVETAAQLVGPLVGGLFWSDAVRAQRVPYYFAGLGGITALGAVCSCGLRRLDRDDDPGESRLVR